MAEVRFVIETDNMRDAFDSLAAFLAAVAPSAESYGIALVTPGFPEDIRYAAGEERGRSSSGGSAYSSVPATEESESEEATTGGPGPPSSTQGGSPGTGE